MVGAPPPPVPAEKREGTVVWRERARWAASWRGIRDEVRVMRAMAPAADGRQMLMGGVELWNGMEERKGEICLLWFPYTGRRSRSILLSYLFDLLIS